MQHSSGGLMVIRPPLRGSRLCLRPPPCPCPLISVRREGSVGPLLLRDGNLRMMARYRASREAVRCYGAQ